MGTAGSCARSAATTFANAWGYGGQMLYIVPDLGVIVVMTSDERQPSARTGYRDALHGLLGSIMAALTPPAGDRARLE